MALDQSALTELLSAIQTGGGIDVIRRALAMTPQALIDLEADQVVGASRYQRTPERIIHRNGTRPRTLSTKTGEVELRAPKLREGSFFPSLLEHRRRIDRALLGVINRPSFTLKGSPVSDGVLLRRRRWLSMLAMTRW